MLKIYDKDHNAIGHIVKYKDCKIESEVDTGDKTLSFTYLAKHHNLTNEMYVRMKEDEYVIKEVPATTGSFPQIVAVLNLEELQKDMWQTFSVTDTTIDEAVRPVLAGTGWTVGDCDVTKKRNAGMMQVSSLDVIRNLCMAFMCEPVFDTIQKTVSFYARRGEDKGVYFLAGLNLEKLQRKSTSYDYYTRIIPIGQDGLTIESVNDGKNYLENFQYSDKVLTYIWKDESYTDPQALKEDAELKLEDLSKPTVSYSVDVRDLAAQKPEYSILSYAEGDTVKLIDQETGTMVSQRIKKLVRYPDNPEKNTCEIANTFLTFEEIQQKYQDAANIINYTVTGEGRYTGTINVSDILKFEQGIAGSATIGNINSSIVSMQGDLGQVKLALGQVETNYLKAEEADLKYATIENLNVVNQNVHSIQGDYASFKSSVTDELAAHTASIDYLTTHNVTTDYLEANYAAIDLANIEQGCITTAMLGTGIVGTAQIADGSITDAKIVELTANKITAGTLSVERLEIRGSTNSLVYALNDITGALQAQNVDTLNGEILTPRTITADKIVANAITSNEIAAKTITANNIAANSITGNEIVANSITGNEIAANSIKATNIDTLDLFAQDITATGTISGATLIGGTISNYDPDDMNVGPVKIENGKITTTLISVIVEIDSAGSTSSTDMIDTLSIYNGQMTVSRRTLRGEASEYDADTYITCDCISSPEIIEGGTRLSDKYLSVNGGYLGGLLSTYYGIELFPPGGAWISGKTATNCIYNSRNQSSSSYHPMMRINSSSGNVWNIGGLCDDVGIYGYYAARTENGYDWSTTWNTGTGRLTHSSVLQVNSFIHCYGEIYSEVGSHQWRIGAACGTADGSKFGFYDATSGGYVMSVSNTGTVYCKGEVQAGSISANAFRAVFGNYGFIIRNDGGNTYLMTTAAGDPYGSWNQYITINNADCSTIFPNGVRANGGFRGDFVNTINGAITFSNNAYTFGAYPNELAFRVPMAHDGKASLGLGGSRWKTVYATTASINTSDERDKNIIGFINHDYKKLFMELKPIMFRWKDKEIDEQIHLGLGAQTTERAARDCGIPVNEFAFIQHDYWDEPNPKDGRTDRYGMAYEEISMLVVPVVQEHELRLTAAENDLKAYSIDLSAQSVRLACLETREETTEYRLSEALRKISEQDIKISQQAAEIEYLKNHLQAIA